MSALVFYDCSHRSCSSSSARELYILSSGCVIAIVTILAAVDYYLRLLAVVTAVVWFHILQNIRQS